MEYGIDKISFYSPYTYIDMEDLAHAREVDPGKYLIGIGQSEQAVAPITQDAVSLAANAALNLLDDEDRQAIDMVLYGTESSTDASKSGAVWVHHLTGIQPYARSVELKQACYAGTMGLQMAVNHVRLNPESKVLVLASDIARYGLNTGGEPTQGAGAVAMVVTANPRILAIEDDAVAYTADIDDFWRPTYSEYARVDGQYSNEAYIQFFSKVWQAYGQRTGLTFEDFEAFTFHTPYTKMGRKALTPALEGQDEGLQERLQARYDESIIYNRRVGNVYTGSLYLSLLSLLEQGEEMAGGSRIGLFSYGSGAVGEFFSGIIQEGYKDHLYKDIHEAQLENRKRLTVEDYERVYKESLPEDGSTLEVDTSEDPAPVVLSGIEADIRQYKVR